MSKYIICFLLLVILGMMFVFYQTADCVVNRSASGMIIDWNEVKDCAY